MSRQYDESFVEIPVDELRYYGYAEGYYGERYERIGYTNYYISDDGRVINLRGETPYVIKTWPNQQGHQMLRLPGVSGNNRGFVFVHRLVAEAFVPNPHGYPIVRHLDDDPTNNDYKNLAWGTYSDNMRDCVEHDRMPSKKVYDLDNDILYKSCGDASKALGVTRGSIVLCCKGKISTVKGHRLCYYDELDEKKLDIEWGKPRTLFKRTIGISPSGEKVIFSSRKEASKILGIPDTAITNVIVGRNKQTHGWHFEEG